MKLADAVREAYSVVNPTDEIFLILDMLVNMASNKSSMDMLNTSKTSITSHAFINSYECQRQDV